MSVPTVHQPMRSKVSHNRDRNIPNPSKKTLKFNTNFSLPAGNLSVDLVDRGTTASKKDITGLDSSMRGLDCYPDLTQKYPVPKYSDRRVPRAMSTEEYTTLMRLLRLTIHVLEKHNVSYVLTYGSLIGSYLMHDLLPWDDDVDIFIHNDTKSRVMELFSQRGYYNIGGHHYYKSPGQIFKVFFNSSARAGGYPWRWPFIDVLSYIEVNNTIKAVDVENITVHKHEFYPFHKRPFGPLWLNSPRNPVAFFKSKYGTFRCTSGTWDHKAERPKRQKTTSCASLKTVYPFVKRTQQGNRTVESLMLNSKKFYNITVDESFQWQSSLYGW